MSRSDRERLRDARDFAQYAKGNVGGLSASALASARQPLHAALYGLVVIGETLGRVSAEVKAAAPDLPWKEIANLRNIVVHAYWQIDLEIVVKIIESEIEPLVQKLEKLIAFVERTEQ